MVGFTGNRAAECLRFLDESSMKRTVRMAGMTATKNALINRPSVLLQMLQKSDKVVDGEKCYLQWLSGFWMAMVTEEYDRCLAFKFY